MNELPSMYAAWPKEKWGPGPWQDEPDEFGPWVAHGLTCMCVRGMVMGQWNGYVLITDEAALRIGEKDEWGLETHWEVTWSGVAPWSDRKDAPYTIGFDMGHAFDYCPALESRMLELRARSPEWQESHEQLTAALERVGGDLPNVYRTLEDCKAEAECLAEQVAGLLAERGVEVEAVALAPASKEKP